MIRKEETICSLATSSGGAISVIRMSGALSISIIAEIFFPNDRNTDIVKLKGYSLVYGEIRDDMELIDEVLVSIFRSPHSYTGEDSVEISCHASKYVQQRILELLVKHGALTALPGEFTQRAFLNGRMDLSQAEAVADLIASGSKKAHSLALNQMRGVFSNEIKTLRAELLNFASLIELELDFGEEDVQFADRKQLYEIITRTLSVSEKLTSTFRLGNAIKNGIPVVITGRPNSGKSTLLNRLLEEEKAIVSEIPGTTRDAIEDTLIISDIQFRFTDTAGLRQTHDTIENLGIKKTIEKIGSSSIILLVTDINDDISLLNDTINYIRELTEGKEKRLILLVNKTDLKHNKGLSEIRSGLKLYSDEKLLFISAKEGQGIEELKKLLGKIALENNLDSESVIITNIRHYEALSKVNSCLRRAQDGLNNSLQEDLIAIDIRHAIHHLGEITGEITTEEILGNIFKNFCIGK